MSGYAHLAMNSDCKLKAKIEEITENNKNLEKDKKTQKNLIEQKESSYQTQIENLKDQLKSSDKVKDDGKKSAVNKLKAKIEEITDIYTHV